MTARGFIHLAMVREGLGALVPAIKAGRLPVPPVAAWAGDGGFLSADPIIGVQKLARRIAEAYRLPVGVIVVAFLDQLEVAGRIELSGRGQRDFFIELHSQYRAQPRVITAILGHEVAHIFLQHHGVHLAPGLAEEILTDTAAVLYGFGAAMADTYQVTEHREDLGQVIRVTVSERHLGYLTPDEMGYVLTRSGFGAVSLTSTAARDALAVGRSRAREELSTPPLRRATFLRRLLYWALRWWAELRKAGRELQVYESYQLQAGKVLFRCTLCCQGLRLPTRASLTATCPRCKTELTCET